MSSIITSILGKHFHKYIKDFREEQFECSLTKGTAELRDLELKEAELQRLLFVPENLKILKATCNELKVDVPNLTRLKKDALEVGVDELELELEEPEEFEVPSEADIKAEMEKRAKEHKERSKNSETYRMLKEMKVTLRKAVVSVRTLGSTHEQQYLASLAESGAQVPRKMPVFCDTQVRLVLQGAVLQTVNSEGEAASLSACRKKVEGQSILFKKLSIESLSIQLVRGDTVTPVLKHLPAEMLFKGVIDAAKDDFSSAQFDLRIPQIGVEFQQATWQTLMQCGQSFKRCLDRIPPSMEMRQELRRATSSSSSSKSHPPEHVERREVVANIHLDQWKFSFHNDEELGTVFRGHGLHLEVAPVQQVDASERERQQKAKEEQKRNGEDDDEEDVVPLYQAKIKVVIDDFCVESIGNQNTPENRRLFSRTPSASSSASTSPLMMIRATHRWKQAGEQMRTNADIDMSGATIVLNQPAWRHFINYISMPAAQEGQNSTLDRQEVAESAPSSKLTKENLSKWKTEISAKAATIDLNEWFQTTNVRVNVANTLMRLLAGGDNPASLELQMHNFSVLSHPSWNKVPYVSGALDALPGGRLQQRQVVSDPLKFQVELDGVTAQVRDLPGVEPIPVLQRASMRIYGRLIYPQQKQHIPEEGGSKSDGDDDDDVIASPLLELSLHSQEIDLMLSQRHERLLRHIFKSYREGLSQFWAQQKSNREQIRALMQEAAKKVTIDKVERALMALQAALVYQIEKGRFRFAQTALIEEQDTNGSEENSLGTAVAAIAASSGSDQDNEEEAFATIDFSHLEVIVENTQGLGGLGNDTTARQSVMFRLRGLTVDTLSHPSWPFSIELQPSEHKSRATDPSKCYNFQLSYQRSMPKGNSDVWLALQGLHLVVRGKESAGAQVGAMIPDMEKLQTVVHSLTNRFVDRQQELKKHAQSTKRSLQYLDVRSVFELNDTMLSFYQHGAEMPRAVFKLSHFSEDLEKQFAQLQDELVAAKIQSAQAACTLDGVQSDYQQLQNRFQELEMQLVQTKLALVEAQASLDSR